MLEWVEEDDGWTLRAPGWLLDKGIWYATQKHPEKTEWKLWRGGVLVGTFDTPEAGKAAAEDADAIVGLA